MAAKKPAIHIKKANQGKFSAAAKAHGETTQQYAKKVISDPHASAAAKKRAVFAQNAAGWNHAGKPKGGVKRP